MKRVIICLAFALLLLQNGLARPVTKEEHQELTRRWGIALSAILSHCNSSNLETLELGEINEESIKQWKAVLSDWWGIESRKELVDMLRWLYNEGHSKSYDSYVNFLQRNPKLTASELAAKYAFKEKETKKLIYVESAIIKENKGSLTAWDLGRYVSICRWGYHSGYISEQEAYRYIAKAASKVRATFSSWEEFGKNYIKGRIFWAVNRSDVNQYIADSIGAYTTLTFNELALWKRIPWDLPVKYSKDLDLDYEKIVKIHSKEYSEYFQKRLANSFSADHLALHSLELSAEGRLKIGYLCGKIGTKRVRLTIELFKEGESKPLVASHLFIKESRREGEITLDIPGGVDLKSGSYRLKIRLLNSAAPQGQTTAIVEEKLFSEAPKKEKSRKKVKREVSYDSEDNVTGYYDFPEFNPQGKPAKKLLYKGSGPDGNWFTADDEALSLYIYSYNEQGQTVKEESYKSGEDGLFGTADDKLQSVRDYFYNDEGRNLYTTFTYNNNRSLSEYVYNSDGSLSQTKYYHSAGADGKWRTADDLLSSVSRYSVDKKGKTVATLSYNTCGEDGVLGTKDDSEILSDYLLYHRNSAGKVLGYYMIITAGADKIWQTGDDVIEYFNKNEFDEDGKIVKSVKYRGPGEDGIILTADDVVKSKTLYIYE